MIAAPFDYEPLIAALTAFEWRTRYKPSALCLKQRGPRKAMVVKIDLRAALGSGKARLSEGWLNGVKIYDPVEHYAVGQVLELE